MTKSPSERRPQAVVPVRAFKDRELPHTALRILGAIGHHANRAGVCWPSFRTLHEATGVPLGSVQNAVKTLVDGGYLRRLEGNDYDQKPGPWGMSNRYQVLWAGDDPIPTFEEMVQAAPFQAIADLADAEGSGVRGGPEEDGAAARRGLAVWAAACERHAGSRPSVSAFAGTILAPLEPPAIDAAVRDLVRRLGRLPLAHEVRAEAEAQAGKAGQ